MRARSSTSSIVARLGERSRQPRLEERSASGSAAEEGRLDQRVEDMGALDDGLGQPRGGAQDRGEQVEQAGIGTEQREELDAGRQPGEEAVEGGEGGVGILGPGERLEQAPA